MNGAVVSPAYFGYDDVSMRMFIPGYLTKRHKSAEKITVYHFFAPICTNAATLQRLGDGALWWSGNGSVLPRSTCNVQHLQPVTFAPASFLPLALRASRHCPAAGPGAAPMRPYIATHCRPTCNVQRATFTPLASRLAPLPRCRFGRSVAAPLHRLIPYSGNAYTTAVNSFVTPRKSARYVGVR